MHYNFCNFKMSHRKKFLRYDKDFYFAKTYIYELCLTKYLIHYLHTKGTKKIIFVNIAFYKLKKVNVENGAKKMSKNSFEDLISSM